MLTATKRQKIFFHFQSQVLIFVFYFFPCCFLRLRATQKALQLAFSVFVFACNEKRFTIVILVFIFSSSPFPPRRCF